MRVRVPATSANLGPGFDTLGLALKFYNHFEAQPAEAMSVAIGPGTCVPVDGVSLDVTENLLAKAYQAYFDFRESPLVPASLSIDAHIPLSRGLGSSSTAIVGGLVLANAMHPQPLPRKYLAPWAVALEGHPDNVVPALLGGVRACLGDNFSVRIKWPGRWTLFAVIPPNPVSTQEARDIMPKTYSREDVVSTLQGAAAWLVAAERMEAEVFRAALLSDRIHEPYRKRLIPEYEHLKAFLPPEDILGITVSGSGSTMLVISASPDATDRLVERFANLPDALAHCRTMHVNLDEDGAKITKP